MVSFREDYFYYFNSLYIRTVIYFKTLANWFISFSLSFFLSITISSFRHLSFLICFMLFSAGHCILSCLRVKSYEKPRGAKSHSFNTFFYFSFFTTFFFDTIYYYYHHHHFMPPL